MAARRIDADIDRLYQLAPDEFTAARNALAKTAGTDAPTIRALAKPPIAAWGVNQLYWKRRAGHDALIQASNQLRQAHKAVLAGHSGDLRAAGKAHEAALDAALNAVLSILQEHGHPATDATRQAVLTTLRALPAGEPAGRLTRTLQPGGFEMLAGLSIGKGQPERPKVEPAAPAARPARSASTSRAPKTLKSDTTAETAAQKRAAEKALARAREEAAAAARELREAEHTARREEFEAARAVREAEKSATQVERAREALETAKQELADAEAAAETAARTRDAAERRAREAERALDAARARAAD